MKIRVWQVPSDIHEGKYQTYLKKILLVPTQFVQWNSSIEACPKVFGIGNANANLIAEIGPILDGNLSLEEG